MKTEKKNQTDTKCATAHYLFILHGFLERENETLVKLSLNGSFEQP